MGLEPAVAGRVAQNLPWVLPAADFPASAAAVAVAAELYFPVPPRAGR